jgi:AcrR family transcriptional regulator
VSEPTVYRHFPNRDALLDAAAEAVAERLGAPPEPADAGELPIVAIAVARYFEANASWIRAALKEPALRPLRAGGRKRRVERRQRLVAPVVSHLDPREREIATAAFNMVCRVDNWDCLTREFGLTSEEAGRATSWILRAMLDATTHDRQRRRRHLVDDETIERARQWRREPPAEERS